tara:strand:- start:251 stop:385 length:135 start_codon:yes stop_codon:yes gene_type:complete
MEDKNWNPNDWQGRSRRSVEGSYKLAFYSFIGMAITLVIASLLA